MEIEGKVDGGRAAAAHAGCCVFCVLFFVFCGASCLLATNDAYFVESQFQIGQNGRFLNACRQKCITKPPKMSRHVQSPYDVRTFCLSISVWKCVDCCKSVQKVCINFYLGRVSSFLFFLTETLG